MEKTKVIIDCDPGIDDSLAIMLALKSPEIEVIGITIVCGNSPVEMGAGNAKKVLKQMNRLDVPVYIGESKPLKREYVNALDTHGEDGLGESFLPEVEGWQQEMGAVDFMADILKREKVSVIALGPMTNFATLIQKDREAFGRIEKLVSMGGTFKSHGNCSPVAEYNYWCDPDAAALVYATTHEIGKKIHMIGLDVTRKIVNNYYLEKEKVTDQVVVFGGGLAGCECAIHLGQEGKQVHLVEMRTELAPDANVRHRPLLLKEIEKYVTVHTGCRGLEVRPDGVLCETEDNQQIRKEDKRRADNYRYYTGRIWGMSVNFDLALNTELGMEYIEECIQKAL